MSSLHIYIIYSQFLEKRMKYINSTIDFIKKRVESKGHECKINIITEPSKEYIDNNIDNYNKRVKYEKFTDDLDDDFNSSIQPLNSNQISNIEKHREVYKHIINNNENNELFLILEDDVVIGQDYTENIEYLLTKLFNNTLGEWDILMTCLPPAHNTNELSLVPTKGNFKTFLSKSSYFIKADIAKKLLEYTEIFKFTLKNSIARFVYDNPDIKCMYLNKHTFLEGSKIGFMPTSINPNNFLFQNNQFLKLASLSSKNDINKEDITHTEALYNNVKHMDSPDIIHMMSIIHYKNKNYSVAKEFITEAVLSIKRNNGYLNKNSEILNNCINMYQYDQIHLEECKKLPSKYTINKE